MKLYTKEMFLIAAKKCEVSMIDANHIMKYIDEYVKPIELPSDEEMLKAAKECLYEDLDISVGSFELGAKWVIDKIKEQCTI